MTIEDLKPLVIRKANNATLKEVIRNCNDGETPEFILSDGIEGTLVAFQDRCMIIKKGVVTSFMTSSLGGGRTATFHYKDITGIEINSGLIMSTFEILTASYTGKATNSVWSFKSDGSAYEMSNVIPWGNPFIKQVRPQIEWLKRKVQEAKAENTTSAQSSVSNDLQKLAELHKQGVLSDSEFATAKASLLKKL